MLKKEVKMIKNSRAMKVKLFALKMLMCCIAVGVIFIWMRGKGPATCLCDELCVSLHMAVALNLEGLLSVWQRGLLLCWYKTTWFLYKLGSFGVSFRAQEGFFFFGTCLFSFPKCPVSCWSGLAVRSQTSPRSAEVPQVLLHMFVVGQWLIFFFSELAWALLIHVHVHLVQCWWRLGQKPIFGVLLFFLCWCPYPSSTLYVSGWAMGNQYKVWLPFEPQERVLTYVVSVKGRLKAVVFLVKWPCSFRVLLD